MGSDNQGRDLEAAKRHQAMLAALRRAGEAVSSAAFEKLAARYPPPDWTELSGVLVLRSGSSRFVGVPRTGRKTAATFDVIDIEGQKAVGVLRKDEIRAWLWRAAQADD
jgi:hypothetical protein